MNFIVYSVVILVVLLMITEYFPRVGIVAWYFAIVKVVLTASLAVSVLVILYLNWNILSIRSILVLIVVATVSLAICASRFIGLFRELLLPKSKRIETVVMYDCYLREPIGLGSSTGIHSLIGYINRKKVRLNINRSTYHKLVGSRLKSLSVTMYKYSRVVVQIKYISCLE